MHQKAQARCICYCKKILRAIYTLQIKIFLINFGCENNTNSNATAGEFVKGSLDVKAILFLSL